LLERSSSDLIRTRFSAHSAQREREKEKERERETEREREMGSKNIPRFGMASGDASCHAHIVA
jgi:hypothetical protein